MYVYIIYIYINSNCKIIFNCFFFYVEIAVIRKDRLYKINRDIS